MVPHTSDGRVMFAIPWHGHTLVGTTDTPVETPTLEPRPLEEEIEFILETAGRYLSRPPTRDDVLSVFVGIRPLVKSGDGKLTAALSRDHTIHIDASGLLTTTGGKWTTYRSMAEHAVDQAADLGRLTERPCVTRTLNIHGFHSNPGRFGALGMYGSDAPAIQDLMRATPSLAEPLHAQLPYTGAEVVWAARHEMARTVEDVLARRTRALFLNARAAEAMAPEVARLMATELDWDAARQAAEVTNFSALARGYQLCMTLQRIVEISRRSWCWCCSPSWRRPRLRRRPPPAVTVPPISLILPNYNSVPIGEVAGLEGGAFVARANDTSSGFYNPAGPGARGADLSQWQRGRVSVRVGDAGEPDQHAGVLPADSGDVRRAREQPVRPAQMGGRALDHALGGMEPGRGL